MKKIILIWTLFIVLNFSSTTFRKLNLFPSSGIKEEDFILSLTLLIAGGSWASDRDQQMPTICFLLGLLFDPEDGGSIPPKRL
jgi:hypothetical protein